MSTLAQLRAQAKLRYRDLSNTVVTDEQWNEYLAEGERAVHGHSPFWPWLERTATALTITAGANSSSLPTYAYRVLSVYNDTDNLPMDELQPRAQHYHDFPEQAGATGVPEWYRLHGGTLYVYPFAEAETSIKVEYLGAPNVMSLDADVPTFPVEFHSILVHFALAQAYLDDNAIDRTEAHMAQFLDGVERMKHSALGARGESYPQIMDTGW